MRENFGNGWVDRGKREAVKGWDSAMRGCKANTEKHKVEPAKTESDS